MLDEVAGGDHRQSGRRRNARPTSAARLDKVLPPADTDAGNFLARVRWLAEAMPDFNLPRFDDAELEQLLPEICYGLRSLDEVRTADWLSIFKPESATIALPKSIASRLLSTNLPMAIATHWRTKSGSRRSSRSAFKKCSASPKRRASPAAAYRWSSTCSAPTIDPQQVTADLASFWQNGYPEVKKELRRRYPKHSWPDDPLATPATRSGLKRDAK